VWYSTITDRPTGTGFWLHGELVAPTRTADGASPPPHVVAWAAVFPVDGPPVWRRLRSEVPRADPLGPDQRVFECDGFRLGPDGSHGRIEDLAWELSWDGSGQRGIATFGRPAWERELLPAAQVVPAPDLSPVGWVEHDGRRWELSDAHGQCARIHGHGNAERWGWLHAELGGGDLVELVSATSTRPGLNRLPPVCFVRFRLGGEVWPASPLPALRLRTRLGLPTWTVSGRIGRARLRIEVTQPAERNVEIDYADPDGRGAVCTNTERADLRVELRGGPGGLDRTWFVEGRAHAEVGTREGTG